ncbi:MAG: IgGFc-binding protein, partial [Opitutaceae bacterium]|nr:IgGFc-binding protein [Cytophagales bacterium]
MKKKLLLSFIFSLFCFFIFAQDFSNKGKDFYLCFPQHVPSGAVPAKLSIWITSDKASSGTITMPNGAFSSTFNISANGLAEISVPNIIGTYITNAESSNGTTNQILKKSIRIKVNIGQPPVVAYVQQYGAARSTASLLLPTTVLGRKYFTVSFTQNGTNNGANLGRSQFQVIATKDNTIVTITPRKNGVVGTPFTITLPLAGDMFQYQSNDATAATQDLTGTFIESVASGFGGCLPIAVFSGSSALTIGRQTPTACNGGSFDPILQQLYPTNTWGKNFGLVPFANYPSGVPYRILASEDNTNININGAFVATINKGQFYPAGFTSTPATLINPTNISADKPICVIEYAQTAGCAGNIAPGNNQGDPDMVILNPIEQNISDITIFSTKQEVIRSQWVNVLIKTSSVPSFKISRNGGPLLLPTATWLPFTMLSGYSYLRQQLTAPGSGPNPISDSYRLVSDSGFNATAYGLGDFESYAYSAGTYIKDLYQQISVQSQYGIETSPSVCTNSPFKFRVSLPYCADSIKWNLSNLPGPPIPSFPVTHYTSCVQGAGGPDSTTVVNGKTIYWYALPNFYTFGVQGIYPVIITTYNTSAASECGTEQDIEFDLGVYDPPTAGFSHNQPGCLSEPVQFTDTTQTIKPNYQWNWNFGDPSSGLLNTSTAQNPNH